jgi:hypothetical protein
VVAVTATESSASSGFKAVERDDFFEGFSFSLSFFFFFLRFEGSEDRVFLVVLPDGSLYDVGAS